MFRRPPARRQATFHPDVREAASSRRPAPALPSGSGRHLAPVILQPAERRDVRAALSRAPVSRTVRVWLSRQEASPDELPVRRASEQALPSGLALRWAQAVPLGPPTAAWWPDVPVWPDVPGPRAAAVSAHAAAGPPQEAASAPSAQQVAAEVSDASRAAEAAVSDVKVPQPAAARQADVAERPSVAVRSGVQEPRAAAAPPDARRVVPLALPSEAASAFRQGPSLLSEPARSPTAARFAHAMRSLQIALRSEPSWQAARNEGWSCGSTSPEGSLTKFWIDEVLE